MYCIEHEYNNRRRDEAYVNEVSDDAAEYLTDLLHELKQEKNPFKKLGIDFDVCVKLIFPIIVM